METVKLTNNEKSVLVAIVANAKSVGDNGVEFILEDVAKEMGKNIRSISATAGSLAKKGMLLTANGESYFDGEVTEAGLHEVKEDNKVNQEVNNSKNQGNMETNNFETPVMDERIVKLNELKSVKMSSLSKSKRPAAKEAKGLAAYVLNNWDNQQALEQLLENAEDEAATELGKSVLDIAQNRRNQMNAIKIENGRKETEARLKKAASKKETKKADKTEQPKENTAKTARKVGDVHPKHPTWIWTEYAPGKFDWRTNPKDKKQGQRTDKTDTKKEPKTKAADKKAAKAKAEIPKKEEKKQLTLEEWLAMPKTTKQKSSMSKAQKDAFKLINKGYRVTADKKFFENENNERKGCNWASVEAMLRRYGIDYIPVGLVKEAK
jgi:hypothetical protein